MSALSRIPPPTLECVHLFTSHNWGHSYRREDLHVLIERRWIKGADFRDFAISEDHPLHLRKSPRALMDALASIIRRCDVLLVFAGMEASYSEWMEREVIAARSLGVPVLAVVPYGAERRWRVAVEMADLEVSWRAESVCNAILSLMPKEKAAALQAKLITRALFADAGSSALGGLPPTRNRLAYGRPRPIGPPTSGGLGIKRRG